MFSERETQILKILGRRRMPYSIIAEELFTSPMPIDAEIMVGNCIRRIIKKCEVNKLKFQLVKKKINGRLIVWRISI